MTGARANAAQAEILKRIRDTGEYKTLNLTWEQFCVQEVGSDRAFAVVGNGEFAKVEDLAAWVLERLIDAD